MIDILPLHDAYFDGAILRRDGADLHFRCADGRPCMVHLAGIDALQMEDFREGNIVSHFEAVSGELPRDFGEWERLYPDPHPSAARDYHRKYDLFMAGKRSSIAEGKLTIVLMSAVLGADLLAVCKSVRIEGR